MRLFNDDYVVSDAKAKADAVVAFLGTGDQDGLRRFIEAEKATLEKQRPGN